MKKGKNGNGLTPYKTYRFITKDPVIDIMRTAFEDRGETFSHVSRASGVSATTYHNWFKGNTRRPQFASCQATVKALGYEFRLGKMEKRFK